MRRRKLNILAKAIGWMQWSTFTLSNRGMDKCLGVQRVGPSVWERPAVREIFTEEVVCEMRAHLSLEQKCFPAIMTNGCSTVSQRGWNRNNDSISGDSSSSGNGSNNNKTMLNLPSIVAGTQGFRSASFLDN